jgi:hypothetical protein
MKGIKKIFAVILIFSVLLYGCGGNKTSAQNTQENKPVSSTETSSDTETSKEKKTAVLYTGRSCAEFEKHSYQYSGELTAEVLGEGLSELIGLDFLFTNTSKSDGIVIDWNANSSLFGEVDMKKASRFFGDDWPDGPSIDWFMLDSLWETLTKNLGVENVYYTMNGGKELVLDGLHYVKEFPKDIPYMGMAFYIAHSDVKGDESNNQNTSQSGYPFHVDESMLSDPPEGELDVFGAQELLNSNIILLEGTKLLDWPDLNYVYRGIHNLNGREYYYIDLCFSPAGGNEDILTSYLVGGDGTILSYNPDTGEYWRFTGREGAACQSSHNGGNSSDMTTAVLYTNMECGSETAEFKDHSYQYSGLPSGEALAEGLSELTGLNFSITVISCNNDGILVSWNDDSSLIAGIGDMEQKEEFFCYDVDSTRWFMMDSLWKTLTENLGVENVYYTMNGDNKLVFNELYPVKEFPEDIPYMGSVFYFAHADNR